MERFKKLGRDEMKNVLGGLVCVDCGDGDDGAGTCSVSVVCFDKSTISCSGSGGNCHHQQDSYTSDGWVQCDKDSKVYC